MAASWGNYLIFPFYIIEQASAAREWRTDQVESLGFEIANSRWQEGRWSFSLDGGKVLSTEIDLWDAFVDAVKGAGLPFLFRMNTRRFEINQQSIGTGNGSNQVFQLKKTRAIQGVASTETILYPWHNYPPLTFASGVTALDTEYVQIWVDGVAQTHDVDYTVDRNTGLVTMSSAPPSGKIVTASCKYMLLVRGVDLQLLQSAGGESWTFDSAGAMKEVRV